MTRLRRTPDGYASDLHTVKPVVMGDGPRSQGHREWRVTNTITGARKTLPTLYAARDYITNQEKT